MEQIGQSKKDKSVIVVIGTGGTIAGRGSSETDLTGYTAGVLRLDEILRSVPGIEPYGPFIYAQFANIESSDITVSQWRSLSAIVQRYADRDEVSGIVITHGTDSMEETAYFLNLTVHTDKPIIMTGAMRPAGAVSADGPINLLQAIQTARTPAARGKGVLVVFNGYIDGARDVMKTNTTNVAAFSGVLFGHMGIVQDGIAHFYNISTRRHTGNSEFTVSKDQQMPHIPILTCYAGIDDVTGLAMLATKPDGLILAGLGHGTIPKQIRAVTDGLDIPVVRASRTGSGIVSAVPGDASGYLVSDSLSPQKARILLMVALTKTKNLRELNRIFGEY